MILTAECDIETTDTSASLYEKLANLGPKALVETLTIMAEPNYQASAHNTVQDNDLATYAHKLDKTEAELNWQLSAKELDRKVRAYIPWPVSQFTLTESESKQHKLRIWQASVQEYQGTAAPGTILKADKEGIQVATTEGSLRLEVLQLPGKKALPVKDILNGRSDWFVVGSSVNKLG